MNKKIYVAVALGLSLLGARPLIAAEDTPSTGGNPVKVYSCQETVGGVSIWRTASSTKEFLTSSCRDAGHGLRQYSLSCTAPNEYYVSWKPCVTTSTTPASQPAYILSTLSLPISNTSKIYADYSFLHAGNQYWAKQAGDIPAAWNNFSLEINTIANLPGGYTYAYAWVDKPAYSGGVVFNSGTSFDEKLTKTLAQNLYFNSNKKHNFVITDYYRGKMVTFLAFARNNDGISRVPGMPTEVDDVIAIHFYIPAKSVPAPLPDYGYGYNNYSPIISTPVYPTYGYGYGYNATPIDTQPKATCSNVSTGDAIVYLCDGYIATHAPTGVRVQVEEHDNEAAQLNFTGLKTNEATLGKGQMLTLAVSGSTNKFVKISYYGSAADGRAIVQLVGFSPAVDECANQIGSDGQYSVCVGKSIQKAGTSVVFKVTSATNKSVFLKATGANTVYYNIKKNASKTIIQKSKTSDGGIVQIKVTYKGLDGKKAILAFEGQTQY